MAKKESAKVKSPKAAVKGGKVVAEKKQKAAPAAEPVTATANGDENEDEWEDEESEMQVAEPKANNRKARRADKQKPKTVKPKPGATAAAPAQDEDDEDEDSEEEDESFQVDLARLDDTDSDSEISDNDNDEDQDDEKNGDAKDGSDEDEDEEEDLDLDDISIASEDEENIAASARVRQTINNKDGLLASLKRFALDTSSKVPFAYHQSVVSKKVTEESIPSVDDDIVRELAFMNQALEAARTARTLLRKENVPFTRPNDYFAEMLRSDEIMDKVKGKLIEDATAKKASAEARKQRELKKFGKQVQVAKQQERAKQKREALDKINLLKRKRQENGGVAGANEEDIFDVAVENELKSAGNSKKRSFGGSEGGRSGPNAKRQKKDAKYGHGGKKKYSKSGDAMSSGDLSGFNAKKMKSGGGGGGGKPVKSRLGKSRRKALAGKR
ncbi:Eukaryotic rRNA processing protein EBP2 domain containing protein [Naviculisporaceae sp. PSN 640]